MTVKELIEQLQQCDHSATVVVPGDWDEGPYPWKVTEVVEYDPDDRLVLGPKEGYFQRGAVRGGGGVEGLTVVTVW